MVRDGPCERPRRVGVVAQQVVGRDGHVAGARGGRVGVGVDYGHVVRAVVLKEGNGTASQRHVSGSGMLRCDVVRLVVVFVSHRAYTQASLGSLAVMYGRSSS